MSDLHDTVHSYTHTDQSGPENLLLVWDAPNLDMGLGAILGGRPTAAYRPRFDAIGRWLLARAGKRAHELGRRIEPEATV
ncbi:MAG: NYN domain-containing protein, partial [Corynebacterium sp.]|nr:NYN domain-containing protein [Corynebacterium sp.]